MIGRLLGLWAGLAWDRPKLAWLAVGLVTAGAVALLPRFEITGDVSTLLPADDPAVALARSTGGGLGERSLLVVLRGDSAGRVAEVAERLRGSPRVERVDARVDEFRPDADRPPAPFRRLTAAGREALRERLSPAGRREAIAELRRTLAEDPVGGRELALADPLGLRWILAEHAVAPVPGRLDPDADHLVTRDGGTALVRVVGRRPPHDVDYARALLADMEERLAGENADLLGGYVVARTAERRIRTDMTGSLTAASILICLFLAWSLRGRAAPLVLALPTGLAILWALAYGGLLLGPLTPLAAGAAAIMAGLGVDFAIHWQRRHAEEGALDGPGFRRHPRRAAVATGAGAGPAILIGMLTTGVAFLSLAGASVPGLRHMGVLPALGLVGAFVATLTLMPRLAPLAGGRRDGGLPDPVVRGVRAMRPTVAVGALAAILLGSWWPVMSGRGPEFDADPRHMRPADEDPGAALATLAEDLGFSPLPITVAVDADAPEELVRLALSVLRADDPELLEPAIGSFAALPPDHTVPATADLFAEDGPAADLVPATLADLEAAGFAPEPFRAGLVEWQERLTRPPPPLGPLAEVAGEEVLLLTLHPARIPPGAFERRVLHRHVDRTLAGAGVAPVVLTDPWDAAERMEPVLQADLRRAAMIAMPAVLLLTLVLVGDAVGALLALVPAACGLGLVLAGMAAMAAPLTPGNLAAVPMVVGIGVDDGIHMVLRARERGSDAWTALRSTGPAIWRTSVTSGIGFGSLAFAASPALRELGLLAAAGIAACLVVSVVFLPPVLAAVADRDPR